MLLLESLKSYRLLLSVVGIALVKLSHAEYENKFEATRGCLQFNAKEGYDFAYPYFPTEGFKNILTTPENVTIFRVGMLGKNAGHVRLSPKQLPYDGTAMNEILISGWSNTKTEIRRYTRSSPRSTSKVQVLKHQSSDGLLSEFRPLMFTIEIHPDGVVKLIKDDHVDPMVQFQDSDMSFSYMGFCNWDVPMVYFFDCPMQVDQRECNGAVSTF
ncbi:uncharacterized protein LOC129743872 [Uranotaenia lowii]|uniref:uncharacterized protein LOC129743872 n=1 Tax=Uranotaenia lowii TaxID=190385 RepID=UPI00247948A1|nr:uncharacterized protein LOC129743872 [Uranotaenia lowii]